jgi:8-oxo-dGTP pyrophosphatase MutT (NUDIX family)
MGEQKGHGRDPHAGSSGRVDAPLSPATTEASRGEHRLPLRHRIFVSLAHLWFRLARGMTMGVRIAAFDGEGRVFLVRHTYVPGWHLPGGGIEVGQTALEAAVMELREEGHLALSAPPVLFGIYLNLSATKRDHVVLYLARDVVQTSERRPDREIAEARFFALDALPEGVTRGTLRRLADIREGRAADPYW